MPSEIISEQRATSNRNGGRDHPGMPGDFRRNQHVAHAIDKTGHVWARNPSPSGFSIPLLDRGKTRNFYPDFLVWKNDTVFAIDPKGEPYLATDAGRKILSIRDENGKKLVVVRLITLGRWNGETFKRISESGYTAWTLTNTGKIRSRHKEDIQDIVAVCLDERF
jgi:type III restriction enzyme